MKCQEWWGKDDSFSIPVDWAVYHSKNTEKKRSEEAELGQADDCRSTYVHDVDQVSAGSPLVEDCEELIKDAAKGHTWVVSDVQKTLKTHGTCAIGAQLDEKEGWDAKVGNVDIQQTLRLAIDRHTKVIDGVKRVAAMGHMKCQGTATRSEAFTKEVNWAVYHSK
ncbi:putative necrosis-inducing factor-domain-containing protein [Cladorrhinum sp. PSN259]|nr:putative necrosis-inducing factor-domain-containing protein [Cladorrhinum sp. PSN259]